MGGRSGAAALVVAAASLGCVTMPTGPSVMVLPGSGKPFEVFQADDFACRQWSLQQAGGEPAAVANANAATSAAVGTAVGAGLGAAIGAAAGDPGAGAAIGAGSGLLGGTLAGVEAGAAAGWEMQRRYDIAYQQCMYAKGNQIPGAVQQARHAPPPPPPGWAAPPRTPPPRGPGPPPPPPLP
jgi:hypothetical protein